MATLFEDSQLYKGIFWITDLEDIGANQLYFQIPVDAYGNIDLEFDRMCLNSKNADNYNHKNVWGELSSKETHNKPFDYYPRGRVEIANAKATIYLNSHICTTEVIDFIKRKFNLTDHNGIKKVSVVVDGSDHYQCYLDKE